MLELEVFSSLSRIFGKEKDGSKKQNDAKRQRLNPQKNFDDKEFKQVLKLIDDKKNVFITGGAGTGKSYILNQLKEVFGDTLHITSTTGISAINISGQTIHSWSGIGRAEKPVADVVKQIKRKPVLYKQIILCKMLAIDEISMLDWDVFDYLNDVLKLVRESNEPFGGIQALIFGDFFQLPPVSKHNEDKKFCFKSRTWNELDLDVVLLDEVKRQSETAFIEALNNVRIDKTNIDDLKVFYERDISPEIEPPKDVLRIFSTNKDSDNYNAKCFSEIDAQSYEYSAVDELYVYDKDEECTIIKLNADSPTIGLNIMDLKCLEKFDQDCKAPKKLELKEGCRVMLLQNLDIKAGLANGSCGTVEALTAGSVEVLFDNGVKRNLTVGTFEFNKEGRKKVVRNQYPLRLAYGITIHKSQGMTFDNLVVNFNKIFDYGQAYVALSRTRTLGGLYIKGFNHNKIKANDKVIQFYNNLRSNMCSKLNKLAQNDKNEDN